MGIPSLNYYLRTACKHAIEKVSFRSLSGKKIAIDTSIYLYKFKGRGSIIENLYIMCTLFQKHNIIPIFVFDGKPPPEKRDTIARRIKKKKLAEKEFHLLKAQLKDTNINNQNQFILKKMKLLEKQFIRVKNWEINHVKDFLKAFGVAYMEAPCEADMLCAKMVIEGIADACLSEDMDLFVYGCPWVWRYLNMRKEEVSVYNLEKILDITEICLKDFRHICILAGTDYSSTPKRKTFQHYYKLFKTFTNTTSDNFHTWLYAQGVIMDSSQNLAKVENLFDINSIQIPPIIHHDVNTLALQSILTQDGFIFPP